MAVKDYRHVRKATVVQHSSGKRVKLGGYRPEKRHADDKTFRSDRFADGNLPAKVDLRSYMTAVENQGDTNSCTANAMAGAYEYLAQRLRGQAEDVSRLFIYYNARQLDGDTSIDEGTYLQSCIQVLQKYGACSERTWAFEPERIFERPHDFSYDEAANFLVEVAERVDVDLDTMRSCLAEGYPFAFGLQLFGSFQKVGSTGLVPMPNPEKEKHDGGHAMLCVGYSDPDQVFIVRNSWGEDWGDRGYCYIPYNYMTNADLNSDCWTIHRVSEPVDLSEDIAGDDSSLFSDEIAAIVRSLQTPGSSFLEDFFNSEDHNVTYEEEYIYTDEGLIPIDEVEDIDSFYYWDETEEETEDAYEEESEDETEEEEEEEVEDSYEEEEEEVEDSDEEDEGEEEEYEEEEE
ncbi:MAG: C1 family peptidase [Leptolyngbyaceae cyanobacterium bins.302]|nr:C1 family peptidase [Leptolyngbyaceae cyanobacterium bins.302]